MSTASDNPEFQRVPFYRLTGEGMLARSTFNLAKATAALTSLNVLVHLLPVEDSVTGIASDLTGYGAAGMATATALTFVAFLEVNRLNS